MSKGRLEAFSDCVISIIITIMVLELRPPDNAELGALRPLAPSFLSYVLSFIYIGIYWNNHHNISQAVERVTGATLWANLHLLFWLSLVPFVTSWMGRTRFATLAVALYGCVMLLCAVAWEIERQCLLRSHDPNSILARALHTGLKECISLGLYLAAIASAFFQPWLACTLYATVAAIWLVPDRRIERQMQSA